MKTPTYHIFLSFADEDKDFALALCKLLEANQISVWCSATHVPAGADIHAAVSKALPVCEYFLPLISKSYNRAWHEKEFHSASHNRHNDCIIPVLYQTNYNIIEQNMHLFSLISSIRALEATDDTIEEVAQKIIAKINTTLARGEASAANNIDKRRDSNKSITSFKTLISEKVLHSKLAQIVVFMSLFSLSTKSIYDYVASKEEERQIAKAQKIKQEQIATLTDTLVLAEQAVVEKIGFETEDNNELKSVLQPNGLKSVLQPNGLKSVLQLNGLKSVLQPNGLKSDVQQDDKFALKIRSVVAKKQSNGLPILHFTIVNKGKKSVFFNSLILEVSESRGTEFKEVLGKEIETIGIWEVPILASNENIRYKHKITKSPSKLVEPNQTVELSVVLYREQNGKRVTPEEGRVMQITFLSSENLQASSRDFYFEKNGDFVYDE